MVDSEQEQIRDLVKRWSTSAVLLGIEEMTPDASLRRYFRVRLSEGPANTALAMVFDSIACAEHSGGVSVTTDQAYVSLSEYLSARGILVPELYVDFTHAPNENLGPKSMLLIEDIGDRHLKDIHRTKDKNQVFRSYQEAINQLITFQRIAFDKHYFSFQRQMSRELYEAEMMELVDYTLPGTGLRDAQGRALSAGFSELATYLCDQPQVLVHRDFHSWNLMIDANERIRIIDFQDALLGTRCYDVVALLNDRDTDSMLGRDCYKKLLQYFFEQCSSDSSDVEDEYFYVLLQRDLKVAGRFSKLSKERGLLNYEAWIPGTERRIGEVLARVCRGTSVPKWLQSMRDILVEHLPSVSRGHEQFLSGSGIIPNGF